MRQCIRTFRGFEAYLLLRSRYTAGVSWYGAGGSLGSGQSASEPSLKDRRLEAVAIWISAWHPLDGIVLLRRTRSRIVSKTSRAEEQRLEVSTCHARQWIGSGVVLQSIRLLSEDDILLASVQSYGRRRERLTEASLPCFPIVGTCGY